jgi:phosphoribosylformimino-5-aminoimidazole carboxamide ribotide isomerase
MKVIPAIDIIGGSCVRLTQGKFDTKKSYFPNPVKAAEKWKKEGAEWLHIVDLDGARTGKIKNINIAAEIKKVIDIKVEYGGGIRDVGTLEKVIKSGIDRAILGTKAIEDMNFLKESIENFGDRIILSLDYGKDGLIYKNGWQKRTALNVTGLMGELEKLQVKEIIITDISRDGTLKGINFSFIGKILKSSNINLIIAGGISSLDDIINFKKLEGKGISGVILGKSLYEGSIDLKKAIEIGSRR